MSELSYANRTGRPPGRLVRTLGLVMPGVARVWSDVGPYADAWHAHNLQAMTRPGRRWVVLGDSMAQGIGASSYLAGWAGQLDQRLRDDGLDLALLNLSATGARVPDVLAQQLPAWRSLPRPDGSAGELVVVLIGSNDLFAGGRVRAGLPEAMGRLVDELPDGSVVATLPQSRRAAQRANRHLEQAEAAGRLRLVDMRTAGPTSWKGKLAADLFHPNDAGYAALADAFEPVVRDALTSRR